MVSNFHPGPIPGNVGETIFSVSEVADAEGVACFLSTSLEEIIGGRNHLVPPEAGCMQRSPAVLECAILGRKHGRDRL